MIRLHYHYLAMYIIKESDENILETQKINDFINSLSSNKGKLQTNPNNNLSSSIRREEHDRPLRRPTTPMTNLSSTSNSQVLGMERKSIASKLKSNLKAINVKIDINENSTQNQNNNQNIYYSENIIQSNQDINKDKIIAHYQSEEIKIDGNKNQVKKLIKKYLLLKIRIFRTQLLLL